MVSRRTRAVGTVAALAVAAGGFTLLPGAAPPAAAAGLVPYSSCEELLTYYRSALERNTAPDGRRGMPMPVPLNAESGSATAAESQAMDAVGSGPTGTNLQERGVDEPDLAKTLGDLLFAFSEDQLQIVRKGPQPQLLSSFALGGPAYGAELLVQDDRVLVLMPAFPSTRPGIPEPMSPPGQVPPTGRTTSSASAPASSESAPDSSAPAPDAPRSDVAALSRRSPIAPDGGSGGSGSTRLMLLDVKDPAAPRLVETLELTGRYLSARLSGGTVRLVTASTPSLPIRPMTSSPYGPAEDKAARAARRDAARSATVEQVLPHEVRRSATGTVVAEGPAVPCEQVRHASSPSGAGTLLVTTLDLGRGLGATDRTAVTTEGDLVYASVDRLYVATSRWGTAAPTGGADIALPDRSGKVTTELHAFDTTSPSTTPYAGSASVAGYVYGRWALSSHAGHLRVATTSAAPWSGEGPASSSTVTVLQEKADGLVETGKVDGLGKGERIYAVRYFGDLATVVTFRQTDPLYVLDLANPRSPKLLGELKVPGFSTYLHPVGGDRLLGIGSDADSNGRVTGMQVSLFDLSDRSRPVQLDRLSLGTGHSLAMDDSRAFGYDPQRRLALMPLSTYDMSVNSRGGGGNEAVGIRVTESGKLEPAGRLRLGPLVQVERVLHDSTSVYAVSRSGVVAGRMGDLGRTGSVDFGR